jgi:hypothetical protein
MTTANIHIINTTHGSYVNLNDVIKLVLSYHNRYPSSTSLCIYDSLADARKEHYETDLDIGSDPISAPALDSGE